MELSPVHEDQLLITGDISRAWVIRTRDRDAHARDPVTVHYATNRRREVHQVQGVPWVPYPASTIASGWLPWQSWARAIDARLWTGRGWLALAGWLGPAHSRAPKTLGGLGKAGHFHTIG